MTFKKPAEMEWWMQVYAAAIRVTTSTMAGDWADRAVTDFRERIPKERPEGSQVMWPGVETTK